MWSDDRLCQLLDIEHPIVQAPMASATTAAIAAAVSRAGGLGSYGAAGTAPTKLREVIRDIKSMTDRPYNINLFVPDWEPLEVDAGAIARMQARLQPLHDELGAGPVPDPAPMFGPFDEQLDVMLDEEVPVISFHFGAPADAVARCHASGAKVLASATTVDEAKILVDNGVDVVIAQGAEAGGHRGTFEGDWRNAMIGTMALVPQIAAAVSVPVIAAGGLMNGASIVAAMVLGAAGAQLGTAFLGCPESGIDDTYRQALREAGESRPEVTKAFSGKPARGLRNRYMAHLEEEPESLLPFPAQYSIFRGIRAQAAKTGNPDFLALWAGQGVGLATEAPAQALFEQLVREARDAADALALPQ
ncbi:MAG: nitronate monooxygenase [Pseudomonadota bacterium]